MPLGPYRARNGDDDMRIRLLLVFAIMTWWLRAYPCVVRFLSTIGVAGCLFASAAAFGQESTRVIAQGATPQGRYQIVFSPFARADTFLLDSETGRIWQLSKYVDRQGEPVVWEPMTRLDSVDDFLRFNAAFEKKPLTPASKPVSTPPQLRPPRQ